MPESSKLAYKNMKKRNRIPIWMFTGVAIITGIIGWNIINNQLKHNESYNRIKTPTTGDVYEIELDEGTYTTYKVKQVTADSVSILFNEYTASKLSGIESLKYEEYNDTALFFSKSELKDMFDRGDILEVDRN